MRIGIAGAGIMGRLLAWQLHRAGHDVTLFDREPVIDYNLCDPELDGVPLNAGACSYSAAGMLTPWSEAEVDEPLVFQLGLASLTLWPQLVQRLGAEVYYQTGGTLVVAHRQDRADFNRFSASVQRNARPNLQQMQSISASQLTELEPELAGRFHDGIYMPDEAWLCACCLMPALGQQLLGAGVGWYSHTEVARLEPGAILVQGRTEQRYAFDLVIDTRGLGARPQLRQLRGVRGEILWVRAPDVRINRLVRLMHPRYRIYLVPRRDDLYLIGATQIESEDHSLVSVRSSLELLSAAFSLHPGFGEGRVVRSVVNCRPALPDNQPRVFYRDGQLAVNGLFRHGYLMSPAIANEVVSRIEAPREFQSNYDGLFRPWEDCA